MLKKLLMAFVGIFIGVGLAASLDRGGVGSGEKENFKNRRIVVYNDSSYRVLELYASNVDRRNWEEDMLGDKVMAAGQKIALILNDGSKQCRFDLLAIMSTKEKLMQKNVDVCRPREWHIRNVSHEIK